MLIYQRVALKNKQLYWDINGNPSDYVNPSDKHGDMESRLKCFREIIERNRRCSMAMLKYRRVICGGMSCEQTRLFAGKQSVENQKKTAYMIRMNKKLG